MPYTRCNSSISSPASEGGSLARGPLFEALYPALIKNAGLVLRANRGSAFLTPTDILHEAFIRLATRPVTWHDEHHFMALVTSIMRKCALDYLRTEARRREFLRVWSVSAKSCFAPLPRRPDERLPVEAILERAENSDMLGVGLARVVHLDGLSIEAAANRFRVSKREAERALRHLPIIVRRICKERST